MQQLLVQAQHHCQTDLMYQQKLSDPNYRLAHDRFEKDLAAHIGISSSGSVAIIPVVVHIIHEGGIENISDAQVLSQMAVLNRDLRRLNTDTVNTNPIYKSVAADFEIELCLASKDPSGNASSGIDRQLNTDTTLTYLQMIQLYGWNNLNYLNIYISKRVGCFSSFPWDPPAQDGIFITHGRFGTIGTAGTEQSAEFAKFGRTATHEVGHYLGLYHTFSNFNDTICNSQGDLVCDTPPADMRWMVYNCMDHSTNTAWETPDLPDQVDNYMDYNTDSCTNMFSAGQKVRAMVTLNSPRANLISAANLVTTGCQTASGIYETTAGSTLNVYPNPLSQQATLVFQNPQHSVHTLNMYDIRGKLVRCYNTITGEKIVLEKNGLTAGLYFIQLYKDHALRATGKIIIE